MKEDSFHQHSDEKLNDDIKFLQIRITELEKSQSRYKLADELLHKTELQQRAILNTIPDIAWLKDTESKFIVVNEAFGKACGFKPEELVGKTDFDIWPSDLAQRYRDDDKEVMDSKARKVIEEPLADKEGKIKVIETIKTPVFDEQGKIIGTVGIARDITERKAYEERLKEAKAELEIRVKVRTAEISRANEELRKEIVERKKLDESLYISERKYRTLFEANPAGILMSTTQGFIKYANPKACELFGYSESEFLRLRFEDLHPYDAQKIARESFNLITEGNYISKVIPCKKKDGSLVYMNITGATTVIDNERVNVGFFIDVTERINEERRVRKEKDRIDKYFNVAQIITVVINSEQKVELINEKGCEILGYPKQEIVGKNWFDNFIPQSERESVRDVFFKIVSGQIKPLEYFENRILTKNGEERVIAWHNAILQDGEGITGTLSSGEDITEKIRIQLNLEESQRRYQGLLDSQKELIVRVDMQNRFTYVNDAYCRTFGKTKEELLGKTFMPLVYEEDVSATLEEMKKLEKPPFRTYIEQRVITKEGLRWFGWEDSAIKDSSGITIEIQGVGRDITEEKKAREDILKYQTKLESLVEERTKELNKELTLRKDIEQEAMKLKKQIEFILGVTKTGLDIIDSDFNMLYVDSEWAKVYGDYHGKKCYEYFMKKKAPCVACGVAKALKTKKVVITEERLKFENNRPIQVISMPYQDENGNWLVAEVNVDISERKKIEQELDSYRQHLEDMVKIRTEDLLREIKEHKEEKYRASLLAKNLAKSNKKLQQLALTDSHTGLYNHRYLGNVIEAEFQRAKRYANSLAIIMLDIDYFKSINDVYGHQFGDIVLKQFAAKLKKLVRKYDIVVRFGGEEFIVISPGINREQALNLSHRILESLNLYTFGNEKHKLKLKLSMGVVSYPDDKFINGMELIDSVEQILNKAKESGGNRVYSLLDIKKEKAQDIMIQNKGSGIKILQSKIDKLNKRANQSLTEAILAFAKTIELKDHYTGEHVELTGHYATLIANKLELPKEEVELIRQASMLHDLGKIGISEKILLKRSKLTNKEFEEIKKHPQIGADILRPIHFLHNLIPIIFYHHERWDGKGYPGKLKGEEIPVGARIIALADVYQALTSDRPYRKAYSKAKAMKIIRESSGKQFDPRITTIFLNILEEEK